MDLDQVQSKVIHQALCLCKHLNSFVALKYGIFRFLLPVNRFRWSIFHHVASKSQKLVKQLVTFNTFQTPSFTFAANNSEAALDSLGCLYIMCLEFNVFRSL